MPHQPNMSWLVRRRLFTEASKSPRKPGRDQIADSGGRLGRGAASSQLNVCILSFSELSGWRSNTCVAMPEKSAGLPSLSLPFALHFAVP
jgi:hypothetical protein